jgi:two-component system, NtrC family, nitrogen regulation sensor histidine kinase NtrY
MTSPAGSSDTPELDQRLDAARTGEARTGEARAEAARTEPARVQVAQKEATQIEAARSEAASPMVQDDAPPLPGTDEKAFSFGLSVVVASLLWGLATYLIMTGLTPVVPRNDIVALMIAVNVILICAMIAILWVQIRGLRQAWKQKIAGARLHARVVTLFSVIALIPAVPLATGATITFSRGLDSWFGQRTRGIIENSLEVANAYLEEHGAVIRSDVVNMAKDMDDAQPLVAKDPKKFRELLFAQASLRDLPVAYIINGKAQVLLAAVEDERIPYLAPPIDLIMATERGQVPLIMPSDQFRVAALARLQKYPDSYLYVARGVSPKVIRHLRASQAGVADFEELRRTRNSIKFTHGLIYYMMALTALSTAIWAGIWFASRLVAPIRRLITASQLVARGNLGVVLPLHRGEGDLRRLSMNFNNMTQQLQRQRQDLMTANDQLTERRRFMEAVLTGVSAGVLGIDEAGYITIANRSAEMLLGRPASELVDKKLIDAIPEFEPLLVQNEAQRAKKPQTEVVIEVAGEERTFATRFIREAVLEPIEGAPLSAHAQGQAAVLTFDDVTDLAVAQRTSAWAEIARRLAHEIKNPLTPIQLSAERLKRKYSHVIQNDRDVFDKCTDTIIRQVGDVARMVDEFSSFARMPKPEMAPLDLREALKDPVNLFQLGTNGQYEVASKMPDEAIAMMGDRRLLSQALTNLIKNATEAVQSVAESKDKPDGYVGRVETSLRRERETAIIEIIDNGTGLPKQNRARLLEPYVTTKGSKGTGLGLAIVQKIVEAHGGTLALEDAPVTPERPRGALIRITLPAPANITAAAPETLTQRFGLTGTSVDAAAS